MEAKLQKATERLRYLIEDGELTLQEISQRTGISQYRLRRFAQGISQPRLRDVVQLADCFQVRCEYIIGLSD